MRNFFLIPLLICFLIFVSDNCFCAKVEKVVGKWLIFNSNNEVQLNILGLDKQGYERVRSMPLSKEEFFPNGYIYPYESFYGASWYACQLIYKKDERYYVVGFATFELDSEKELVMEPRLLFDWNYKISTQKMYWNIDFEKCPEISAEQVIPLTNPMIREKYMYDKLHGNISDENSLNANKVPKPENFTEMFLINQSE